MNGCLRWFNFKIDHVKDEVRCLQATFDKNKELGNSIMF